MSCKMNLRGFMNQLERKKFTLLNFFKYYLFLPHFIATALHSKQERVRFSLSSSDIYMTATVMKIFPIFQKIFFN